VDRIEWIYKRNITSMFDKQKRSSYNSILSESVFYIQILCIILHGLQSAILNLSMYIFYSVYPITFLLSLTRNSIECSQAFSNEIRSWISILSLLKCWFAYARVIYHFDRVREQIQQQFDPVIRLNIFEETNPFLVVDVRFNVQLMVREV